MKKMMKAMWILAASTLAFSSCVEEQALAPQNENPETVNIKITAGAPVTKTHLDGTMQVKWDTDSENMVIFENTVANNKTATATGPDYDPAGYQISADGSTATFSVEFPYKSGNEFNYWGLYPAKSFISADNSDLNNFKMQIPSTQKPKASTFDYKADLLISRKITKKSQPWGLTFNLARPIAVVEMTLKGIGDGEKITEVTFSSESAPITGQLTYNMNTNEVVAYGIDGQKKITLETNLTAAAAGTKIYFTALPAALDDFTVTAKTDKATYEKKVNCAGKNFGFKANTFTQFPVNNLTRKVTAKPVVTITWDKNTELDGNGGDFSIPYTIENPVEGAVMSLTSMNGHLQNLKAENGNITFTMDANPNAAVREDYVIWEYKTNTQSFGSGNVKVIQAVKLAPSTPVLNITWDNTQVLSADGGTFTAPYTLENPVEGATIQLSTYNADDFIKNLKAENGNITFDLMPNTQLEEQNYTIFVDYTLNGKYLLNKQIKVKQAAGELVTDFTVAFNVISVSHNSITVKCTPSDLTSTYVIEKMEKMAYDATTDAAIIEKHLNEWTPANWDSIDNHLITGEQEKTFSRLTSDKEYYIIAYGLNSDGTVTSKAISKTLVKTPLAPYFTYEGWDDSVNYPKAGGHFEVIVNIQNANPALTLTAEAESVYDYYSGNYITNVTNITVEKLTDSQYKVVYDVLENTYGKEIEVKIKLIYGTLNKKLSKYQSNL